jgi:16S rRNA (cytosine1402-N4)-methyltransferase
MSGDAQLALPGLIADTAAEWVWCEEGDDLSDEAAFDHQAVMKREIVLALAPREGAVYLDATLGRGGHTMGLLEAGAGRVVALDRDETAIRVTKRRLAPYGERAELIHATFSAAEEVLASVGVPRVQGLCADLGVSSPQLDDPTRGMSFRREGPIDMRMDTSAGETALDLIDRLSDDALADVLYRYGEEHRSRRIARSIKRAFGDGELKTTLDLRRAIVRAVGPVRVGGVDPATRTFQALRIAVNGELDELKALLALAERIVVPGGIVAILSFHSLEDRIVKRAFTDRDAWEPLWKKPREATDEETAENPRARTAKLRAAARSAETTAEP